MRASHAVWLGFVVLAFSGGAYAGGLVTGQDVKNESLTGKDVKNGSLEANDLNAKAVPIQKISYQRLAGASAKTLYNAHHLRLRGSCVSGTSLTGTATSAGNVMTMATTTSDGNVSSAANVNTVDGTSFELFVSNGSLATTGTFHFVSTDGTEVTFDYAATENGNSDCVVSGVLIAK